MALCGGITLSSSAPWALTLDIDGANELSRLYLSSFLPPRGQMDPYLDLAAKWDSGELAQPPRIIDGATHPRDRVEEEKHRQIGGTTLEMSTPRVDDT